MIKMLQSISVRERVMLGAFIIVMLLIWGSSLLDRWETTGDELSDVRKEVKQQKIWIDSEPMFQAQLNDTMAGLDTVEMMDANELTAFVDSYAREHQLKHEMSNPTVKSGKIYTRSTIRVTLRNISLKSLIEFQLQVNAKQPYISMDALALAANRADPRLLNARISLTALMVNPIESSESI